MYIFLVFPKKCRIFAAEMKIIDEIKRRFYRAGEVLLFNRANLSFTDWGMCRYKFSNLIWYNICDLICDLIEDVEITDASGARPLTPEGDKFAAYRAFVFAWGRVVLQRLYDEGFCVIGYSKIGQCFWIMDASEYDRETNASVTLIKPKDVTVEACVLKSQTFIMYGKSDREICRGFLSFLDDTLNGSATVSKRLGAVVIASPKNLNSAPTATVLTADQKKEIEENMRKDYGALSNQSNVMLLPREMSWQTINLAGLDLRMQEKVKTAILAIVDRIKVPANQVAIIDAQSSKQLANGSEMREGDKLKYKTFRRLFERTFADMARYYGLKIDYVIDGEPVGDSGEVRL